MSENLKKELLPAALLSAKRFCIAPRFLVALIELESGWNPLAMRHEPAYPWLYSIREMAQEVGCSKSTMEMMQKTSWGLGQVMGAVAYEHGLRAWAGELFRPEINLKYVCEHIQRMIRKFDIGFDVPLDLYAAYNAGSVRMIEGRYVNSTAVGAFRKVYQAIPADIGLN